MKKETVKRKREGGKCKTQYSTAPPGKKNNISGKYNPRSNPKR